ncbi:hypothetical protein RND81_09G183800 [Saponaria officinalis]|uniref:X8 domain-containing protein n=1 Tax=Saponaria officinalis TaxID=3572 RepID=A0AAW1IPF9_SAPOF
MARRVFLLHCSASLVFGLFFCSASSETPTVKRDITTPLTTVPTITPTSKPNSIPEKPETWDPFAAPSTPSPPLTAGASWCIASQAADRSALQKALDYACGKGSADCTAIQPGGGCYYPSTLSDHASYAFNSYYQKNPIPSSCDFGGTAVITSTDPSSPVCHYPSTSTSASVLDTTNQNVSTVFGVGPTSSAKSLLNKASSHILVFIYLLFRLHSFDF